MTSIFNKLPGNFNSAFSLDGEPLMEDLEFDETKVEYSERRPSYALRLGNGIREIRRKISDKISYYTGN